jgi:hypothetical protein
LICIDTPFKRKHRSHGSESTDERGASIERIGTDKGVELRRKLGTVKASIGHRIQKLSRSIGGRGFDRYWLGFRKAWDSWVFRDFSHLETI